MLIQSVTSYFDLGGGLVDSVRVKVESKSCSIKSEARIEHQSHFREGMRESYFSVTRHAKWVGWKWSRAPNLGRRDSQPIRCFTITVTVTVDVAVPVNITVT